MARSKKNRPSVQSPAPGSELAHLHLLFIRADYLRQIWSEAAKDAPKTDSPDPLSLEGGYGVPIWASVTLFLASLHTVVEGWRRLKLSNPQVDLVLSDTQKADRLRALRDGVFHYGAIDNPSVMGVVGDREMLAWAAKLLSAFRTFMKDRPKEPRAA